MTDIEIQLYELERQLLMPGVRHNPDAASYLLTDEFREFGSSGRVFDKQQILDALANEPPTEISTADFEVAVLTDGFALVTYRASRQDEVRGTFTMSLRSSIWTMRDGRWQMIFHQGTKSSPGLEDVRS